MSCAIIEQTWVVGALEDFIRLVVVLRGGHLMIRRTASSTPSCLYTLEGFSAYTIICTCIPQGKFPAKIPMRAAVQTKGAL
jgi:hypothetical protein